VAAGWKVRGQDVLRTATGSAFHRNSTQCLEALGPRSSPTELVGAYAPFANAGRAYRRMSDHDPHHPSKLLYARPATTRPVVEARATSHDEHHDGRDAAQRTGARRDPGCMAAGKTGTARTSQMRVIGYTAPVTGWLAMTTIADQEGDRRRLAGEVWTRFMRCHQGCRSQAARLAGRLLSNLVQAVSQRARRGECCLARERRGRPAPTRTSCAPNRCLT